MTIDEAIKRYESNAEYERTHGDLQGCTSINSYKLTTKTA